MKYLNVSLLALLMLNCGTENKKTYSIDLSVSPEQDAGQIIIAPEGLIHDEGTSISLRAETQEITPLEVGMEIYHPK